MLMKFNQQLGNNISEYRPVCHECLHKRSLGQEEKSPSDVTIKMRPLGLLIAGAFFFIGPIAAFMYGKFSGSQLRKYKERSKQIEKEQKEAIEKIGSGKI